MKMTRLFTVLTLVLAHTGLSEDLDGDNHLGGEAPREEFELQPVENDMLSDRAFQDNMNYRRVLFKNLPSQTVRFAFLEYQDFSKGREQLLTVHQYGDGYLAILTIPDQRLTGFTNDISHVSIRRIGKRFPPTIADRVANVTRKMLRRIKEQETPVEPTWPTCSYFFMWGSAGYTDSLTPSVRLWYLKGLMREIGHYIESSPECEFDDNTESKRIEYLLWKLEKLESLLNLTPLVQEPIEEIMAQVESYRAKQGGTGQGKTPLHPYSVTVNAQNKVSLSVTNMPVPGVVRLLNAELDKLKPRPYAIHLHGAAEHDGDYDYWTNPSYVNIPADAKPLEGGTFEKLFNERLVPTITLRVKDMPIQEVIRNIIQQHPAHIYGDVRDTHAHLAPNENKKYQELYEWEMEDLRKRNRDIIMRQETDGR